jgi:probable phosphomutase (TIGR03848 family)
MILVCRHAIYIWLMILFLVRHGLTPITGQKLTGRLPGFHLSEQGLEQAGKVGDRLADVPLKAIYSSPMERCLETAEAIAKYHKVKVETVDELTEIDYGAWQGKALSTLSKSKDWQKLRARPADFRFPGGETLREAQTRGIVALERLRAKHKDKAIAVCSHADMIKLATAGYLGLGIDLYDRITVAPASITTLHLSDGTPRLLNLGDAGSQKELLESLSPKPASTGSKKP